jgi:pimeloyl-ACP methyl ester carboxylesterase
MKHPIVEHKLELGGSQTRALELDGEGPPVLLLHGFGDSADTWRLVLDRLRKRGQAAVALDMPGFGAASSSPATRSAAAWRCGPLRTRNCRSRR